MSDEYVDNRSQTEKASDALHDSMIDQLWSRPEFIVSLASLAPKFDEPWDEDGLQSWLGLVEQAARLTYRLNKKSDRLDTQAPAPSDTPVFKARYVDVLLTRLEAMVEAGADHGYVEFCHRIEEALNSWEMEAPWLRDMYEAKTSTPAEPSEPEPSENGRDAAALLAAAEAMEPAPTYEPTSEAAAQVLECIEASPRVALKRAEIVERTGLNPNTVSDALAQLVTAKMVEKCGESSGTSYRLWLKPSDDLVATELAFQPREPYRPMRDRIMDALLDEDGPLQRQELYDAIGQGQGVGATVARMVKENILESVAPDGWELANTDEGRHQRVVHKARRAGTVRRPVEPPETPVTTRYVDPATLRTEAPKRAGANERES